MRTDSQFDVASPREAGSVRERRCARLHELCWRSDEQSIKILSVGVRHARQGARVLDIGCGFGSFLQRARETGYSVGSVDSNAEAWACKALGEGVVSNGTLPQVKLPAGSADVVTTLDVLEHVPVVDHGAFARAVADVLAPGGIWIIKVPSTEGPYYHASAMVARLMPRIGAVFMHRAVADRLRVPTPGLFQQRHAAGVTASQRLRHHGLDLLA